MKQTWRWFGPDDPVSLSCASGRRVGIVSALHHMNQGRAGRAKPAEAPGRDRRRRARLVCRREHRRRRGRSRRAAAIIAAKIDNYKQSIRNAARAGVKTFCYNFMAITDWTRTDLNWPLPNGGTALRFDSVDFCAYDLLHPEARRGRRRLYPDRDRRARERAAKR